MVAAHRVVMDTLRFRLSCTRGSTLLVGTIPQAHLLLMSLNVAKCNLGYVKCKTMLASSIPQGLVRGSRGFCAGAPHGLQCSVRCQVISHSALSPAHPFLLSW